MSEAAHTEASLHALKKDELVELIIKQDKELGKLQKQIGAGEGKNTRSSDSASVDRNSAAPEASLVASLMGKVVDPMTKGVMEEPSFMAEAPRFVDQAVRLAQMVEARLALLAGNDPNDPDNADQDEEESGDEVDQ